MHSLTKQQRTFYLLLAGMFLLHAAFMAVKFRTEFSQVTFKPQPEVIKLKFLDNGVPVMASPHKKQIVQSEDSASQDKPKEAAFLSDKDRNFDRQTIAKNVDTFHKTALGDSSVTQKAQKPSEAKKKTPALKDLKLSDLAMGSGEPIVPQEVSRAPASQSKKGMKNGDPTEQGFSSTNDYVQEVALGDFTHLNTVEYKFYGFFHRIRQKLEQFWGKSIAEKANNIFRSGRRLASEDYITSLQITLDEKGSIVAVKILGASGVKELDDAAIESFNQAGPFPNPPKDLLVNGKAVIEWGFVVKG